MQYLQTPSSLSLEDSHENDCFPNPYLHPTYPLTPYPTIPEGGDISSASGLCQSSPTPSLNVSSTELQRVLDSLLDQIDWLEVAMKVAKNRAPSVYCNAIEQILLAHIYQLVKAEGNGEDTTELQCAKEDKVGAIVNENDDGYEDENIDELARKNGDESIGYDGDDDEYMGEVTDEDDCEDYEIDEEASDEDNDCDSV